MLQLFLSVIGGVFIVAGLCYMAGGVLGVLRFPDFYTRLHAMNVSDGAGAVLVAVGLAIASGDWGIAVRLLLLAALFAGLAPVLSHALANAAHAAGLTPLAGPHTTPRPGAAHRGDVR